MDKIGLLGNTSGYPVWLIAAIVSFSLLLIVIIAKFIGCTLPLLANKAGLDPALMASPLITTLVDACAVVLYFKTASSVLHISLL